MKLATLKFVVDDDFEPGKCYCCPLSIEDMNIEGDDTEHRCVMGYRFCDCPLKLDLITYAMDEEDITD